MTAPLAPIDEGDRLAALHRYLILDTPPESAFDDLTRLIARICNTPIALISFIDDQRQWFKSRIGFKPAELPRDTALCLHTIQQGDVLVVPDTVADTRFSTNPLVTASPKFRFYAGATLTTADGFPLGTICVLDLAPRDLTSQQIDALRVFSRQTMALLELRRRTTALEEANTSAEQTRIKAETADEILRSTEDRLRRITEATRDIFWDYDLLNDTIWSNKSSVRAFGYTGAEDTSRLDWWRDHMHPDDRDKVLNGFYKALDEGAEFWSKEFRFRRSDGSYAFIFARGTIIRNSDGRPMRFTGMMTDITVFREAELALRESEERFRQLAENIWQVFWVTSADLKEMLYVSPAYEEVWGRSCQSLYDQPLSFLEAAHPEDRARVESAQSLKSLGGYEVEYRIIRPDDSLRWIWARAFPIRDRAGNIYRVADIAEDITRRKEAEEALAHERDLLQALMDNLPDTIYFKDTDSRFTRINRAEALVLGVEKPEDAIGKTDADFQPGELSEGFYAEEQEIVRAGQPLVNRIEYNPTRDGQPRWFSATKVPLKDAQGRVAGLVGVSRNITDYKLAERELQAQKQLFENLVAVARAATEFPTLKTTLLNALQVSVSFTAATRGSIILLDEGGGVTHSILSEGEKVGAMPLVEEIMRDGLAGWVSRRRQSVLVADTVSDERWFEPLDGDYQIRSALVVPITHAEVTVGILSLLHPSPDHFTAEHLRLMEAAADQMALALRNVQMLEQAQRQAQEMYMLNHLTRAAIESTDLRETCQALADRMGELIGADGCYITLWDDQKQTSTRMAASGDLRESYPHSRVQPGELTMTASVLQAGRSLVAEDVFNTPYMSRRIAEEFPTRSLLGLPLIARGQKLGAALIGFNQPHHFTAEEIALSEQVARQMALAVSNALLYNSVAEERGRLQALIHSSRDGVVLVSLDQRLLICNATALSSLNLPGPPGDWLGRPLRNALRALLRHSPEVAKAALSEMRRIQIGNEPAAEGNYQIGPTFIHWLNLPVMISDAPLGRLIVLRDVTEERALARLRDDLTHMLVHDLRSPLTAIFGAADVLHDQAVMQDPKHREMADMILDGAERLMSLVNEILDVSQLENGRMPLARKAVNVAELIVETLQLQIGQLEKKQIQYANAAPHDLPPADADARLIGRVLQNLISNAVKFAPTGGAIHIAAEVKTVTPPALLISIQNTGAGIPPEIKSRLFQKFVRGQQPEHGSGLGLAFCRLAVEAHGGRIWVDSEPEQGATFKFTLPIALYN